MDRNRLDIRYTTSPRPSVALRKESVDRNTSIDNLTQGVFVALRKESVDRNLSLTLHKRRCVMSLSARRAWIEICSISAPCEAPTTSLSARRAWIEINVIGHSAHPHKVALRKESVDRNTDPINLSDIPPNVALRKESVDRNGLSRVDTVSH